MFAGSLLTFIPAMGDYINAELLGNPQTRMIGNVIQNRLLVQNDYPVGSALSFILMAGDPRRGGGLRPRPRHRAADRLMATTPTSTTATGPRRTPRSAAASQPLLAADRPLPAAGVHGRSRSCYLLIPIAVMIVFSFNKPDGQVQLHLERVLARRLAAPVRLAGPRRRGASRAS